MSIQRIQLLLFALFSMSGAVVQQVAPQSSESTAVAGVRKTLDAQVVAWNSGDLTGFMDGYVRDESLRFSSGGSVRRGWQEALLRYQTSYPTREKMGTLTFSDLEFLEISENYTEVFGKYHLARNNSEGDANGLFTLLMKREADRWLVLHDHTSAAD
jgi:ketosteroid isomerase-like protein